MPADAKRRRRHRGPAPGCRCPTSSPPRRPRRPGRVDRRTASTSNRSMRTGRAASSTVCPSRASRYARLPPTLTALTADGTCAISPRSAATAASISASVTCCGRNRLQHFAFGVLGRGGLTQPDGRGIRLVGRGQQAEDLGGPLDTDHQHAGGHRVQRARVPDLAGGEDAPAPRHHVVAGHPGGLVDDTSPRPLPRERSQHDRRQRQPVTHRPAAPQRGQRRPRHRGRVDQDARLETARGPAVVDGRR